METKHELTDEQILITKKAYSSFAKRYSSEIEWSKQSLQNSSTNIIRPLLKYISGNSNIAHVGCGTGRDVFLLNKLGYSCDGYDVSEGMLSVAKSKDPEANFSRLDISKSPLPANKYDAVLAESVLSFIKHSDIQVSIQNLISGLKKGGVLFLGFKDGGNLIRNDDLIGGTRYFICYDEPLIRKILAPFNFDILSVSFVEDFYGRFDKYINFIVKK